MWDVSRRRARAWAPKPGSGAAETVEMIVLLGTVMLAVCSLIWLATATRLAHMDHVRWQLWIPSKTQSRDYSWELTLATGTAVAIATAVMLVLLSLAAIGNASESRGRRNRSRISGASRVAAVTVLPLTLTLPAQFAAYAQTRGWTGDGHAMEMFVRYGPFPAVLLGFLLLFVAEVVVGVRSR